MTKKYSEYLEEIKQKLDRLNKASGFDPSIKQQIQNQSMPSQEIFDMLGKGAKMWLEKQNTKDNL